MPTKERSKHRHRESGGSDRGSDVGSSSHSHRRSSRAASDSGRRSSRHSDKHSDKHSDRASEKGDRSDRHSDKASDRGSVRGESSSKKEKKPKVQGWTRKKSKKSTDEKDDIFRETQKSQALTGGYDGQWDAIYEHVGDEDDLLEELEPSPVDETPTYAKEAYFPQRSTPPGISGRSGTLGLSGHGPAYYLSRVQKYSSIAFTAFAALHITNTSILPLVTKSVPEASKYLLLTRPYYQSPYVEPIAIGGTLAAHIISGLALRVYRRQQNIKRYGAVTREDRCKLWPSVSGTSKLGFMLVPLVAAHVYLIRGIPLWVEGGSSGIGLEYISHTFARFPKSSVGGFTALVAVGSWHVVWGMAKWLGLTPGYVTTSGPQGRMRRKRRWYVINAVSVLVTGLWLAGGVGVVGHGGEVKGWMAKEYDALLSYIPYLGKSVTVSKGTKVAKKVAASAPDTGLLGGWFGGK